jgi:hypothetical protein
MGADQRCAGDVVDLAGLAVMCWNVRQRWVSRVSPSHVMVQAARG